jgi:hypothetical protein
MCSTTVHNYAYAIKTMYLNSITSNLKYKAEAFLLGMLLSITPRFAPEVSWVPAPPAGVVDVQR